ncbi:MAG: pyridoxal phosphate-dependent aminotransferase [Muribaculaceae bacterium]
MPSISRRGRVMPASPIRKLAPYAAAAQARGIKILSLNIGQPDLPTPQAAFDTLHSINRTVLEYSPSDGLPSLRRKMAEYYKRFDIDVTPEQIIMTCGGSESVLFAFLAALDPGDEVILPEPAYANYVAFSKTAGARIIGLPSSIDSGFALPPIEEFEKCITPSTKAILICNPNNPTGYVYSKEELEQIRDIVKRHDLFLFSDEVYREFCYTDKPIISALQLKGIEDQVVVVDSVSKRYNECGIRIGALVTRNKELHDTVMKFCQARLSPPLVGQLVAEASVDTPNDYLEQAFGEYRRRRDFLLEGLNSIPGVFAPMPMGAFYAVARLPVKNAEDFCRWCLEEFSYNGSTVFMAPAAGFYTVPGMGHNEVRVAYVLKQEDLEEAVEVLRAALDAYPGTVR